MHANEAKRTFLSGVAALSIHCVAVFGFADARPEATHANSDASQVWMTLASEPARTQGAGSLEGAAAAVVDRAPRTRRVRSKRAQTATPAVSREHDATTPASQGSGAANEVAQHEGEAAGESVGALGAGARGAGHGGAGGSGGALLRGPALLALRNPCRGFFPASATVGHGEVRIDVEVDAQGHARLSRLLQEIPRGQGFGSAAQACAAALRFAPAIDQQGLATAGQAKLELRFDRS